MRRQKGKCLRCLSADQMRFRAALYVPEAPLAARYSAQFSGKARLGFCGECDECFTMVELDKDKTRAEGGPRCAGCLEKWLEKNPQHAATRLQPSVPELLAATAGGGKRKANSQPPPQVSPSLRTRSRGLAE